MDRISIILQDKALIQELMKDNNVVVRVSDAVVDAIGRRCLKISNSVSVDLEKIVRDTIENEFTSGSGYKKKLKPKFHEMITAQVKADARSVISSEMKVFEQEVRDCGLRWREMVRNRLIDFDYEKIIREEAAIIIQSKFGK